MESVLQKSRNTPVLIKLSPDLSEEDLEDVIEASIASGISGLIATNTTSSRPVLNAEKFEKGGLSGAPLFDLSRSRIASILRITDSRLPIIGCGGVDRVERAQALLDMGCAAVQLYTGLVYQGPGLIKRINDSL